MYRTPSRRVERYTYDAYGQPAVYNASWTALTEGASKDNALRFCGYVYDADVGLYHVRHRTYTATLGRWLQRDPAGYVDGMGLYEYCRSTPSVAVDPTGLAKRARKQATEICSGLGLGWELESGPADEWEHDRPLLARKSENEYIERRYGKWVPAGFSFHHFNEGKGGTATWTMRKTEVETTGKVLSKAEMQGKSTTTSWRVSASAKIKLFNIGGSGGQDYTDTKQKTTTESESESRSTWNGKSMTVSEGIEGIPGYEQRVILVLLEAEDIEVYTVTLGKKIPGTGVVTTERVQRQKHTWNEKTGRMEVERSWEDVTYMKWAYRYTKAKRSRSLGSAYVGHSFVVCKRSCEDGEDK